MDLLILTSTVMDIVLVMMGGLGTALMFLMKFFITRYFNKKDSLSEKGIKIRLGELMEQEEDIYAIEKERLIRNNIATLTNIKDVFGLMNETKNKTNINRFVIFNTHNGDGQPNYVKPYKVSVLQYNTENSGDIRKYQALEVDEHYTKMLIKIQENPSLAQSFVVDDMPQSMLKTIYMKERVKYSEIHFLETTKNGIIYCSLATFDEDCKFSSNNDRYAIQMAVGRLRNIFREENKRVMEDDSIKKENEKLLHDIKTERRNLLKSSDLIL